MAAHVGELKLWNADTELWDLVSAPIYANNEAALVCT